MDLYADIINRLEKGQTVYLLYDFERIAIRCVIQNDNSLHFYAKLKGRNEHAIKVNIDTVILAMLELKEITKEQYESF
jgi:hypothetical protein